MKTCTDVIPGKGVCGRPARGTRHPGNNPLCGIHLRSAINRGEGVTVYEEEDKS